MKVLIIGQGLAGSVLALTLSRAGIDTFVHDQPNVGTASNLAAGVVNPVTGKRYARSWNFHLFYPFAKQFYRELEADFNQAIWFDLPILRLLGSPLEWNEWSLRAGKPEFQALMTTTESAGGWEPYVQQGFSYGLLTQAGRADFQSLISLSLQNHNRYSATMDGPDWLATALGCMDKVIFCEGAMAANNPFFPALPWNAVKGERLLIRIPEADSIPTMLKKQIIVAPMGKDLFWAGANYDWNLEDPHPTETGKAFILSELQSMLRCSFSVEAHHAGIRPVLKDRRPVVGWSSANPQIGIFNGMGSKGALLAPYWADHLLKNLTTQQTIDPEVNVQRFTQ